MTVKQATNVHSSFLAVLGELKTYPWIAASWVDKRVFDRYRKRGNMEIVEVFDDSSQECHLLYLGFQMTSTYDIL